MRKFASCAVLTKAFRYADLLAPMDLGNCPSRSCALLRAILQRGLAQMISSAVEA